MKADPAGLFSSLTHRSVWASPRTATALGLLAALSLAAVVPLAVLAHRFTVFTVGVSLPVSAMFAAVGVVVARSRSSNPIGWLLLGFGLVISLSTNAGCYALLRYRLGYTGLPLGQLAVFLAPAWVPLILLLPLPVALFPDGRMPTRFWRVSLWLYAALAVWFLALVAAMQVDGVVLRAIHVDGSGETTVLNLTTGGWGTVNWLLNLAFPPYAVISLAWVVRQVRAYRRSTGVARQQLKSLMAGGGVGVVGLIVALGPGSGHGAVAATLADVGILLVIALPLSIGVGILRYRLYDIDRLISRTLSYLIITGLLAGVFVGIVVLTTDVLPFSSPVGVAASTLAAAALFNPLRLRVQRLVDLRFNRARYDAEAIVAAFTMRLRDAVDLDTVRHELLQAVDRAVEPAHASGWIRPSEQH